LDDDALAAALARLPPRDQAALLRALRDAGEAPRIARIVRGATAGPAVLDLLADALLSEGRPAEALNVAERRERAHHASSTTLGLRSRALAKLGRLDEARALLGDPAEYLGRCLLAEALLEAGEAAEARRVLEAAVAEHPSRRRALVALVDACAALGDWTGAAAFAARLEEDDEEGELSTRHVERLRAFHAATGGAHRLPELDAELAQRRAQARARIEELVADVPAQPAKRELPADAQASAGAPRPPQGAKATPVGADELARVAALVKRHLGFDELREGQAETIARVLRGESVLAVMPTGGGKSICYQLPGVLTPGVTLVVSPLLALMKDQLDSLPAPMRAAALSVTSELTPAQARRALDEVARGRYRLLYVAPERLRDPRLLDALRAAGVARLVVDEAHCVSVWGHDFRPEYLGIADARRALGGPPLLALTATAPPRVAKDVLDRLGPLVVVRASVERPNLRFEASLAKDADEKLGHVFALCREATSPTLVYASSRAKTEQLAAALQAAGVDALAYHAGMPDRAARQEAFMDGRARVMVATVAFGMGVDKGDIRLVLHHDPSSSLENYYQEAGRAGRDGAPARCVLLATAQDGGQLKQRARADLPSRDLVSAAWRLALASRSGDVATLDPAALAALEADEVKPRVALSILVEAGALERLSAWEYRVGGDVSRVESVLDRYAALAEQRAKEMMDYARARGCRHRYLRAYFGEDAPERCGNCDRCLGIVHEAAPPPESGDDEAARRAVLDVLQVVRGVGESNLVWLLRGDARAAEWLQARAHGALGALAMRSESRVRGLVRDLEARGLVARETLAHGGASLRITDAGVEAAFGKAPLAPPTAPRPAPSADRPVPAHRSAPAAAADDPPLLAALKRWRLERADAEGVPPYVVAHDSALRLVAQARPRTLLALGALKGFGPKKVEKYGGDIIALVGEVPNDDEGVKPSPRD
jgi:ATP-dependent DNA helicase RecQ